ncbi:hypothetical protein M408DRAFT_23704 [Serendipita vermifera MAFF 305830]|uniref:Uncharacterized protein n=1 Tax=Serendipita vermifera MAFF 305830 TaxID=933852 RepID=A0A0C2XHV7_SERVB|nr:hypothetical protein M408DRAFT_23704 [Serendipita vermifera MAFF 305830]
MSRPEAALELHRGFLSFSLPINNYPLVQALKNIALFLSKCVDMDPINLDSYFLSTHYVLNTMTKTGKHLLSTIYNGNLDQKLPMKEVEEYKELGLSYTCKNKVMMSKLMADPNRDWKQMPCQPDMIQNCHLVMCEVGMKVIGAKEGLMKVVLELFEVTIFDQEAAQWAPSWPLLLTMAALGLGI